MYSRDQERKQQIEVQKKAILKQAKQAILDGNIEGLDSALKASYEVEKQHKASAWDVIEGRDGYISTSVKSYLSKSDYPSLFQFAVTQNQPGIVNHLIGNYKCVVSGEVIEKNLSKNNDMTLILLRSYLNNELDFYESTSSYDYERRNKEQSKYDLELIEKVGKSLQQEPDNYEKFQAMKSNFFWRVGGEFRELAKKDILHQAKIAIQTGNNELLEDLLNSSYEVMEKYSYSYSPDYNAPEETHYDIRKVAKSCIDEAGRLALLQDAIKNNQFAAFKAIMEKLRADGYITNRRNRFDLLIYNLAIEDKYEFLDYLLNDVLVHRKSDFNKQLPTTVITRPLPQLPEFLIETNKKDYSPNCFHAYLIALSRNNLLFQQIVGAGTGGIVDMINIIDSYGESQSRTLCLMYAQYIKEKIQVDPVLAIEAANQFFNQINKYPGLQEKDYIVNTKSAIQICFASFNQRLDRFIADIQVVPVFLRAFISETESDTRKMVIEKLIKNIESAKDLNMGDRIAHTLKLIIHAHNSIRDSRFGSPNKFGGKGSTTADKLAHLVSNLILCLPPCYQKNCYSEDKKSFHIQLNLPKELIDILNMNTPKEEVKAAPPSPRSEM